MPYKDSGGLVGQIDAGERVGLGVKEVKGKTTQPIGLGCIFSKFMLVHIRPLNA
jgi:hypothetical protein